MYSNVLLCFFALAIVAPQSAHAQYPVGPNWPTVDGQGSRGGKHRTAQQASLYLFNCSFGNATQRAACTLKLLLARAIYTFHRTPTCPWLRPVLVNPSSISTITCIT